MPPTGSDTTLISTIHHSLIRESDLVGSPDTRRLASMQRIDVAKLVERWRRGGIQGQEKMMMKARQLPRTRVRRVHWKIWGEKGW